MPSSPAEKHIIRRQVLVQLRALDSAGQERRSRELLQHLAPWLDRAAPLQVALYASLPHEVNLLPLLQEFPQHRYHFPRCLPDRSMVFHAVSDPASEMLPATMGISEPLEHLPVGKPSDFDLVVVPGVAFTPQGDRLGYGGGYYDRFLPLCHEANLVALAFREQIRTTLPIEQHDVRIPHLFHD